MLEQKIILHNRRAKFDYKIEGVIEAGVVLLGPEVKSLRGGAASFNDSFIYPKGNEVFIHNLYIAPYEHMSSYKIDPLRLRKLLLHKKQVSKLMGLAKKSGVSIVPLKMYFNSKNFVKLEIAIATGKKKHDKRQAIKDREWGRKKESLFKQTIKE
ncbi:MAG: SsrA-binding protein SmpB [Alphaproteobacteria bacterium]|jgi:SsrA-binding protein|nr:SsrA-binding protein SmpB [Alphaproteobacteria bacterium]MBT5827527.1 SsrA-binding protein SmpB [Alphaproteobacteria bacterium]